jgi:hypothetical protein
MAIACRTRSTSEMWQGILAGKWQGTGFPAKFLGKSQEMETRAVSDRFLTSQKSSNHVN